MVWWPLVTRTCATSRPACGRRGGGAAAALVARSQYYTGVPRVSVISALWLLRPARGERDGKDDGDDGGHDRRHHPDAGPVVAAGGHVSVDDAPGDEGADEVADAVGDEVEEPLRGGADLRPGLLIRVDLAGDEKEVASLAGNPEGLLCRLALFDIDTHRGRPNGFEK
jgi:hypothetical protein